MHDQNKLDADLRHAASIGDAGAAASLLARGADANAVDPAGNCAFTIAFGARHAEVVGILAPNFDQKSACSYGWAGHPFLKAVQANWLAGAKAIVPSDVSRKAIPGGFPDEDNALVTAAQHSNAEMIQLLLDAGADPLEDNGGGDRALAQAAECGAGEECIRLILSAIPPKKKSKECGRALFVMVRHPIEDIQALTLIAREASIDPVRAERILPRVISRVGQHGAKPVEVLMQMPFFRSKAGRSLVAQSFGQAFESVNAFRFEIADALGEALPADHPEVVAALAQHSARLPRCLARQEAIELKAEIQKTASISPRADSGENNSARAEAPGDANDAAETGDAMEKARGVSGVSGPSGAVRRI